MYSTAIKCLAKAWLMLVLSKCVCNASSLTVPRSLVAVIGNRVELKCSANGDHSIIWEFTSFNTSKDTNIYFGDSISLPFQSRYKIDNNIRGQHNLVIESVDLDHSGRYKCVTIATGNNIVAHLTVLDSSPECSANTNNADKRVMENGYLRMRCRVVYTRNMIPIFTWTKENTEDAIATNTSTSDNRTILMTTTSSVTRQMHSDDNSVTFKCKITFQLPKNSQGNAPDFEYTWNYTANDVYEPRNLNITRFEDRLECSADGSSSDPGTSSRTVVAAAVGGVSLLLLLIIIAVSCFVRKKKLKGLTKIHVSFIGRSASVEPDIIDVDIYSYDDIVFNRQTPTEHEQNGSSEGSNAFRVLENYGRDSECIPVYAEVKKGNGQEERERTRTDCSAPVFADVKMKKKAKESLNTNSSAAFDLSDDNSPSPQVSIQKKKRQNRVGADGTEYMDISEVRQPFNMSTARAATQPAFNRTNYAFIDHTARVPPPPPKF